MDISVSLSDLRSLWWYPCSGMELCVCNTSGAAFMAHLMSSSHHPRSTYVFFHQRFGKKLKRQWLTQQAQVHLDAYDRQLSILGRRYSFGNLPFHRLTLFLSILCGKNVRGSGSIHQSQTCPRTLGVYQVVEWTNYTPHF